MPVGWNEIRSDYEKAKSALWCPEGAAGWRRDEATGWYYMWKAFHEASAQEEKDQLLYARIPAQTDHNEFLPGRRTGYWFG